MTSASTLRLIGLAIAGILVAAAVAVVASQLASRQIGLASEPVSAGDKLAPAIARPERDRGQQKDESKAGEGGEVTAPATTESQPPATTTEPAPPVAEPAPSSDDSGSGENNSGAGQDHGDD